MKILGNFSSQECNNILSFWLYILQSLVLNAVHDLSDTRITFFLCYRSILKLHLCWNISVMLENKLED